MDSATLRLDEIRKHKEREQEIKQIKEDLQTCHKSQRPMLVVRLLVLLEVVHNSADAKAEWRQSLGSRW